jgi:hypothetical protein
VLGRENAVESYCTSAVEYVRWQQLMPRKPPKSLVEANFHPLWRGSRRFTAESLRVVTSTTKSSHFTGGAALHDGSRCPNCKKRLTLLWNLDLKDKRIPDCVRDGFAPSKRLPFYICWRCVAASYSVSSDTRMTCFPFDHQTECLNVDETPFGDAPQELERRSIHLERIPATIDALLSLTHVIGYDQLDRPAKAALNQYLGTRVRTDWDLPISQFGGQPLAYQGHSNMVCPNTKCPASKLQHPYGELETMYLMKEMALIHWEDEPVLAKHCFQLLYYVCGICFSMRAEYRCS